MARLALLGGAAAWVALVIGHAASLGLDSGLGSGTASVARCSSAAIGVRGNLSGNNVASVTVSSVSAACANATIQVAVDNGTASSAGASTVPAGGGAVTVTLSAPVSMAPNIEIDVLLLGP